MDEGSKREGKGRISPKYFTMLLISLKQKVKNKYGILWLGNASFDYNIVSVYRKVGSKLQIPE